MIKQKQGISLMVLILTVIIMVILAGTVIISLNNAGVINRSQGTVDEYNLKQVEELANLAWGEAYLAGNTTQNKLSEYVMKYLSESGVDIAKYYIDVTAKGVIVEDYADYMENGWYKAWTCTNDVWSNELNPGDTLNGEVIAKLYKTGEENKYDLVISGTGEMGSIMTYNEDTWDYDIWAYANEYRSKLRNVIIKDGVTSIGEHAFRATSVERVQISNTVKTIGKGAFCYCDNLLNLTLPSSVSKIEIGKDDDGDPNGKLRTFALNTDLTIDSNNPTLKVENNVIYSKDGKKLIYYNSRNRDAVVPEGVTTIGKYSFYGSSIETIKIADTVTTIEDYAFHGSYYHLDIEEIVFPASVVNFGNELIGDDDLHTIKIHANEINNISNYSFNTRYVLKIYVVNEEIKAIIESTNLGDKTTVEVMQ